MTGVKSVFTPEEIKFMKNSLELELSDTKDYTVDELLDIHDLITEELPHDYDDEGYPLETGRMFESIIDKFYDHFNI